MRNILSFEQFRKQSRISESQAYIEREILRTSVNEGLFTKWKKFRATVFVDKVLKDEIELGKAFEERLKETMSELETACEKLQQKSKEQSDFVNEVIKIITDINKISFDTLTLIGDQDIDFGGFRRSVIMANVVKLGALLSPVKNTLMVRKAYRYFLGLIKQAVRKDLVLLIVNFDQFQSTILQKSMEATTNARSSYEAGKDVADLENMYKGIISDQLDKKTADAIGKIMKEKKALFDQERKYDSAFNGYIDAYNNTYRNTAETIKSLMTDDNQKELEALKNGINKLGQGDEDLSIYGELLISNAEEKALKATNGIHNNFLKMSEVFKLSNQKKLIDLIVDAEKEQHKKIKKEKEENEHKFGIKTREEELKFFKSEFEKIKDEFDLSKITLKEIESLKKEDVKFEFKDEETERETERRISKYNILIHYLASDDEGTDDELKKCSYDLRMLVPTSDDNDTSYKGYIDILADAVDKCLIKRNNDDEQCYIDLYLTKSPESINKIVKYFDKSEKNNQEKVLRYIDDNVIKFLGYKTFLEKIHEITERDGSSFKEVKGYFEKMDEFKDDKDFQKYRNKKKLHEEYHKAKERLIAIEDKKCSDGKKEKERQLEVNYLNTTLEKIESEYKEYDGDEKIPDKDKFEINTKYEIEKPDLSISINKDNLHQWSNSFKEMREYIKNNYSKKEK